MAIKLSVRDQAREDYRAGRISVDEYVGIVKAHPLKIFREPKKRVTVEEIGNEIFVILHGPPVKSTGKRIVIIREREEGEIGGAGSGRRK